MGILNHVVNYNIMCSQFNLDPVLFAFDLIPCIV